ncbi:sigma-54 interaction domain-containing protein [Janthinobacterium sp. Mn2066]|uniref:sigma-54 interaction domain-containing protein n=1 Tax=Janthinobacterium sp. Mn2066 TaxID=3395264 RepID=UPI003BBF3C88
MEVLSLPNPADHAISIRAKALAFEDAASKVLLERIRLIAPSDATVLVTGESGTGKELIARLVHSLSERGQRPFIAVNCGAFSDTLIESELFGHERGAFTGALESRAGWFEAANGGTLFLDEVGDLPPAAQVKLLRVVQEREVVRVGSRKPVKIDVRLVAATNVRLEAAVRAGHFREDLYYRLNVAKLALLPLRERPDDIAPLTRHFIELYSKRLRITAPLLEADALLHLKRYSWPGNIRELENVIHHALLISRGGKLTAADLHFSTLGELSSGGAPASAAAAPLAPATTPEQALRAALLRLFDQHHPDLWQAIEGEVFASAYEYSDRNQLQTARLLNLSRNIVRARLADLGIIKTTVAGTS